MNFLLANDDGIDSKGLLALYNSLKKFGNVYVAAPAFQHSGTSGSLTILSPLTFNKHEVTDSENWHKVKGTPVDCVKAGLSSIYKDIKFDFVFSGINAGANVANDVLYSGTIAAATEGALKGIRSVAVSACKKDGEYNFDSAAKFVEEYMEELKTIDLPENTILNINVPNMEYEDIKGFFYTEQGIVDYDYSYEQFTSKRNINYFFHSSKLKKDHKICTDAGAITEGFASITPIKVDRTDYNLLERLDEKGYKVKKC